MLSTFFVLGCNNNAGGGSSNDGSSGGSKTFSKSVTTASDPVQVLTAAEISDNGLITESNVDTITVSTDSPSGLSWLTFTSSTNWSDNKWELSSSVSGGSISVSDTWQNSDKISATDIVKGYIKNGLYVAGDSGTTISLSITVTYK